MGLPSARQHDAYDQCMGHPPTQRVANETRFMVWSSSDETALGNALNVWAHTLLFALYTARQIVIGVGTVPELLCGPHGVFACAAPSFDAADSPLPARLRAPGAWKEPHAHTPGPSDDWRVAGASAEIVLRSASKGWNYYHGVDPDLAEGNRAVRCAVTALGCEDATSGPRNGCAMEAVARALLAPTPRAPFVAAALASARWRGAGGGAGGELERALRGGRFGGTLHLRLLPPNFERKKHAPKPTAEKEAPYAALYNWLVSADARASWWRCLRRAVGADNSSRVLFVATDADGLCRAVTATAPRGGDGDDGGDERAAGLACLDAKPFNIHFEHANKQYGAVEGERLHTHQLVALDWYLLTRGARAVMGAHRPMGDTKLAPFRASGALTTGKSFFAWARALSGAGFANNGADPAWEGCAKLVPSNEELLAKYASRRA